MSRENNPYGPDLSQFPGDIMRPVYVVLHEAVPEIGDVPTKLDEAALAKAVRIIAKVGDEDELRQLLSSLADALDHPDAETKLIVRKPKAGGQRTPERQVRAWQRNLGVGTIVFSEVCSSGQTEAGLVAAMAKYRICRQTAITALHDLAEDWHKYGGIDFRVAGDSPDIEAVHNQFVNWLDRYRRSAERIMD